MSAKFAFLDGEKDHFPISKMCAWPGVSTSGYYEWRDRAPSPTARRRERLAAMITAIFEANHGTYGYRRIHAVLLRSGEQVSDELVRELMRELDLVACQPRPWRPTTTEADQAHRIPDLLARDFTATEPGTKLVGDITYLATDEGWVYLATVIDCYSKMVVGWAMADHYKTSLITTALDSAAGTIDIRPGCIFHSDRGSNGGLNWPSQHLDLGGAAWVLGKDSGRFGCIGGRSRRRVARRWRGGKTGCGSGRRSLAAPGPRMRALKRACQARSGSAGSGTLAA